MELKQRGETWYVHYEDAQGNRKRTSTHLKDKQLATLAALEIIRRDLDEAAPAEFKSSIAARTSTTLGVLLRDCWSTVWIDKKSARSLRLRVARITREIGHWTVEQTTYARLLEWGNSLTNRNAKNSVRMASAATKNRYMSVISTALTEARKKNQAIVVPEIPHWAENNVKDRFVTIGEERQILSAFKAAEVVPWGRDQSYMEALYIVLVDTGMRLSEATVELGEYSIHPSIEAPQYVTLRTGSTKNGKGRSVPLSDRAKAAVVTLVRHPKHGKVKPENIGKQFRIIMDRLGIEGVTVHTLRHTCASRLVQGGVSLLQVCEWLGHSGLNVTQRYAHLAPGNLMGVVIALDAFAQAVGAPAAPQASVPAPKLRVVK